MKLFLVFIIIYPNILFSNNIPKKKLDAELKSLVNQGSVMVASEKKILYRYPPKRNFKLIPASVLKLATALAAKHYLGLTFQFSTDFYLSGNNSLLIRGRGDPFLVSEKWEIISKKLSQLANLPKKLKKLSFDTSLFSEKIQIPGTEFSRNPYDATNGALVVNFNTVYLKVVSNGIILSAENQTPLTPLARRLGENLPIGSHRIRIPSGLEVPYAGEVIREFLAKMGFSFDSKKINFQLVTGDDVQLYTHLNKMTLSEIIAGMMLYSNNFTANQLLLSIGLKRYGAPTSLKKGNMAIREYLNKELKIPLDQFDIFEGSGISRKNRLTTDAVLLLLKAFSNEQYLLNNDRGIFFKTGTLKGVYNMAGYLKENLFFVILLNQKRNNRDKILDLLLSIDFLESKL